MRTLSVSVVPVLAAVLVAGLAGGCKQVEKATGVTMPGPVKSMVPGGDREMVLEVETFTLDEAEVKDLAGASGGKAVLFASETSSAEVTIPDLDKGTYEVTVYTQGADADHDAFYLNVAGAEHRLYPDEYGTVKPTRTVAVDVAKSGQVKVLLMAAETGVYLDRVVLKKVK